MNSIGASADRLFIRRRVAAALAVPALALIVAAAVRQRPPDFAELPVAAALHDGAGRAAWTIRLALDVRELGVTALAIELAPPGHAYQLWLVRPGAMAVSLGLLPGSGRRAMPLTPRAARLLHRSGRLIVTLEPAQGAVGGRPSEAVRFRGVIDAALPGRGLVTEK